MGAIPRFRLHGRPRAAGGPCGREFSAREVAETSLERIASLDGKVHAFLETTEQLALEAAARVDAAVAAGTLDAAGRSPACPWPSRTT